MDTRYINKFGIYEFLHNIKHYTICIKNYQFEVNFAVENFELFIFDSYGAQIHSTERDQS